MRTGRAMQPATFRRVAWWALAAQVGIVVTGAAVRLTGSGLGCTDWPGCSQDRLVPAWGFHHWVEFGNRLLTFVVVAAAAAAVIGARRRRPYRPSLWWLAWGLVAGVVAQALIGAVLVIFELDPRLTILHFVASIALIADGVALVHVSAADGALRGPSLVGRPDPIDTAVAHLPAAVVRMVAALVVAVSVVVGTGTVVTGSGPHGGDERADRFAFTLRTVARIHSGAMWVFLALLLAAAVVIWRAGPQAERLRPNIVALAAISVAQGVLGYLQYALGVPSGLVALHLLGSALVWSAAVALALQLRPGGATAEVVVAQPRSRPGARPVLSER